MPIKQILAVVLSAFMLLSCARKADHFAADIPQPYAGSSALAAKERQGAPTAGSGRTTAYTASSHSVTTRYQPLSTFALDVSTASYAMVREDLNAGRRPQPETVRVEELINYFQWSPGELALKPLRSSPFEAGYEIAPCPWKKSDALLSITVRTKAGKPAAAPPANLIFLVDGSADMAEGRGLSLIKSALHMLTDELRPEDTVSIITFSDRMEQILPPTSGARKAVLRAGIDTIEAGGATAGAGGLQAAYNEAARTGKIGSRILLCTNGNFNLGVSSENELARLVRRNRDTGARLSIFGVGAQSNDAMLTRLALEGDGSYHHIDNLSEAVKLMADEGRNSLHAAARDVKAQIEFNPEHVRSWRQIGYEKRLLAARDFNDDAAGAAFIDSDRQVTILYQLELAKELDSGVDPLRYGNKERKPATAHGSELAYVKLRWKNPDGRSREGESKLVSVPVLAGRIRSSFETASAPFRFTAAVAAFGLKLRDSYSYANWNEVTSWAENAAGNDPRRAEFVRLTRLAARL